MRKTILAIIGVLLLGGFTQTATGQNPATLQEAYGHAFLIGSAVNESIVSGADTAARDVVLRHFNTITPENVMKAGPINPEPGVYRFAPADAFVAFGEAHDLFIVGHTLVWHNQIPAWFFQDDTGKPNTPVARHCPIRGRPNLVKGSKSRARHRQAINRKGNQ